MGGDIIIQYKLISIELGLTPTLSSGYQVASKVSFNDGVIPQLEKVKAQWSIVSDLLTTFYSVTK